MLELLLNQFDKKDTRSGWIGMRAPSLPHGEHVIRSGPLPTTLTRCSQMSQVNCTNRSLTEKIQLEKLIDGFFAPHAGRPDHPLNNLSFDLP